MRKMFALIATLSMVATNPAFAGGDAYPPEYQETPPVIIYARPPPNPLVGLGALAGGIASLPFVVLGGIFGAAPPPVVSCVAPDGSLFPCPPPVYPAYTPPPTYYPPSPSYHSRHTYHSARPLGIPRGPAPSGQPCYDTSGNFVGGPDCGETSPLPDTSDIPEGPIN